MSYKQGQKLVCIYEGQWLLGTGPSYEDEVTFISLYKDEDGVFLSLSEYASNAVYLSKLFIPLEDWNQMSEEIEEALKIHTPIGQLNGVYYLDFVKQL